MDTSTLKTILLEEMALYAGKGLNAVSYLTVNDEAQVYAVVDFAHVRGERWVWLPLVARLVEDMVYIDVDKNNKPLVDALKARGVPENQIILAYLEEKNRA